MKAALLALVLISASYCRAQSYDIYVSDAGNFHLPPWQILKFDSLGQNPEVFITGTVDWPQDILFLEDMGIVLISNASTGIISKYNISDGSHIGDFAKNIALPNRMKIGPDSLLYVLQWAGNGKVLRYNLDGTLHDVFTKTGVPQSIGFDWDQEGNLYVSSYQDDNVRRFGPTGEDSGVFISSNLKGPTNIWFNNKGELLVADYDGGAVKRFDAQGNFLDIYITGLSKTEGYAIYPNGDLALGDGGSSSVKLYDSTGKFIRDLIPSGSGNLINPNAVVLRKSTPLATHAAIEPKPTLFFPSMGNQFNPNPDLIDAVLHCKVFSATGQQVKSLSYQTWTATDLRSGIYFIESHLKSGEIIRQRIYVQN